MSGTQIERNIAQVRERVAAAARRAGRNPDEIELMAVSKTIAAEQIREAYACGVRLFGENRVQEFEAKSAALSGLSGARFHMIGRLQRNKAARAVSLFHSIESVDSARLLSAIESYAAERRVTLPVLIEINTGNEEQKAGVAPQSPELERMLALAAELQHASVQGLMTVPPYGSDPEAARRYFRQLRELRDAVARRNLPRLSMDVLSMGMSHDFEVAVEEGATRVRVGTAIFGERQR